MLYIILFTSVVVLGISLYCIDGMIRLDLD